MCILSVASSTAVLVSATRRRRRRYSSAVVSGHLLGLRLAVVTSCFLPGRLRALWQWGRGRQLASLATSFLVPCTPDSSAADNCHSILQGRLLHTYLKSTQQCTPL